MWDASLDTSRTVGSFTKNAAILFPISTIAVAELSDLIAEVKDRKVLAMAALNKSAPLLEHLAYALVIAFNYHESYATCHEHDLFASVDIGENQTNEDPLNLRFAVMDVDCGINNGMLTMSVIYSAAMHDENEASDLPHNLSDCFKSVSKHCKLVTSNCYPRAYSRNCFKAASSPMKENT